ncbi:PREDICTED: transcription factor RelB [Mandrillus leucophaeus]|uniref:transcription factor RelB n=1 Tax=Mandrillus leucophaeus TaxID=9568 RepID=UPI0005F3774E|nr:PREDICTED: transcription factor RelB [Mandrillus leucophaeus]
MSAPHLVITEQPKQRGMRFRYECEGRSAGSILGESSTEASKTLPAIEVGPASGPGRVRATPACSRALLSLPHHPLSFNNLGIQCVRKKEIEAAIERKIQLGIDPYNAGSLKNHQEVDMNVVRICFQASYRDQQGQMRRMDPVLSEPVYDKTDVPRFLPEDISVVFSRASWEGRADFSQADVHRQIAIVFKTPPYEDLEIVEPVTVNVFLQRLTDGVCSEPLPFTYLPRDHDSYGVDKKRKRGMPDVLGELNSSDPHGIESKRRKKKPAILDHFLPSHSSGPFLPPSALLPDPDFFSGTVSLPGLEPPGGPDLLDDGFAYDPTAPTLFTMLDLLPPAPPHASAVVCSAGAVVGEPPGPEPLTLDSYQAPGPGDGGTASLVGSNMFPNQYREAAFGGGLLSPGPEAT